MARNKKSVVIIKFGIKQERKCLITLNIAQLVRDRLQISLLIISELK